MISYDGAGEWRAAMERYRRPYGKGSQRLQAAARPEDRVVLR